VNKHTKVGVYYYPWYNPQRWREAPIKYTPLIGEYDSDDPSVIDWQIEMMKYCGIDYVIFELVPEKDWCYKTVEKSIELFIDKLRAGNMQWSFLIDTKLCLPDAFSEQKPEIKGISLMIEMIKSREWSDGLVQSSSGKPMLFVFYPVPSDTIQISVRYGESFVFKFPIFLPHWGHAEGALEMPVFKPFTNVPRAVNMTLFDYLSPMNYISFWESSLEVAGFGGFCSVIPEYDDTLLKRNPQLAPRLDRDGGNTFIRQFSSALSTNPEHIIIYSWNEYFESTNIEPTKEHGMAMVETVRDVIGKMRQE